MSELNLPEKDAITLNRLAELPASDLANLFEALKGVKPGVLVLRRITSAVSDFGSSHGFEPAEIARVVTAVNRTRFYLEESTDAEFVELVQQSVYKLLSKPHKDHKVSKKLKTIITNILSFDNIRVSVKATALAFEGKLHVHSVNIISDLRPVFDSDRSKVQAFFVTNTLKIEYADDDENSKVMFFMLDDDDLDQFAAAIKNARKKKLSLSEFVKNSGVDILDVK